MSPSELDEIERLLARTTPGPWRVNRFDSEQDRGYIHWQVQADNGTVVGGSHESDYSRKTTPRARADAEFTATARTTLPVLVNEVRRLQAIEAAARVVLATSSWDGLDARAKLRALLDGKAGG